MDINERNYTKDPYLRTCLYCGDEFETHHGLQRYCPEKYGRRNYCKNEQKKLVNERKLAELVQDVAEAVSQIDGSVNQLEINIQILKEILRNDESFVVLSSELDTKGYNICYYSSRKRNEIDGSVELIVGPYLLQWTGQSVLEQTFKISRI